MQQECSTCHYCRRHRAGTREWLACHYGPPTQHKEGLSTTVEPDHWCSQYWPMQREVE